MSKLLFQKGHKGYWKGKKRVFSNATKKKMSDSAKGKILSKEHKDKIRKAMLGREIKWRDKLKGENCHWWKGGITPINIKIRSSLEYKIWREAVFKRDNYTCIWCGGNKSGTLNADHIKPFAYFPELRFAIDNGRTLCIDCHNTTDTYLKRLKMNT